MLVIKLSFAHPETLSHFWICYNPIMAHITLTITEEDDEWIVRYYEDGNYIEGPTYYTDDIEDAMGTAKAMEDEALGQGHTVNVEFDEELAGDYLSNPFTCGLRNNCSSLRHNCGDLRRNCGLRRNSDWGGNEDTGIFGMQTQILHDEDRIDVDQIDAMLAQGPSCFDWDQMAKAAATGAPGLRMMYRRAMTRAFRDATVQEEYRRFLVALMARTERDMLTRRNPETKCWRCNQMTSAEHECFNCSGETGARYCKDCVAECNYCKRTFCFEGDYEEIVHELSGYKESVFDEEMWGCLSPWLHNCAAFKNSQ
jgi:hypothetical protein